MTVVYKRYRSLDDFYPSYAQEHLNRTNRRLHFAGTTLAFAGLVAAGATRNPWFAVLGIAAGVALAVIGQVFFERRYQLLLRYPGLSFLADWRLWLRTVLGRAPL